MPDVGRNTRTILDKITVFNFKLRNKNEKGIQFARMKKGRVYTNYKDNSCLTANLFVNPEEVQTKDFPDFILGIALFKHFFGKIGIHSRIR